MAAPGLSKEFGLVGNNAAGECAGREIIDELTGFLLRAVALATQARIATSAGRPRGVMTSYRRRNCFQQRVAHRLEFGRVGRKLTIH
jgi:hypothetical protein